MLIFIYCASLILCSYGVAGHKALSSILPVMLEQLDRDAPYNERALSGVSRRSLLYFFWVFDVVLMYFYVFVSCDSCYRHVRLSSCRKCCRVCPRLRWRRSALMQSLNWWVLTIWKQTNKYIFFAWQFALFCVGAGECCWRRIVGTFGGNAATIGSRSSRLCHIVVVDDERRQCRIEGRQVATRTWRRRSVGCVQSRRVRCWRRKLERMLHVVAWRVAHAWHTIRSLLLWKKKRKTILMYIY